MSMRRRKVTDLFVQGKEVELPDGTYLWVQVLNSYERDEAIQAAQVARSRLVMALKGDGDEHVRVEGKFVERGRDRFVKEFAEVKASEKQVDLMGELEDDPDWSERTRILFDTDFSEASKPAEPAEEALLVKVSEEWFTELQRRVRDERDYLERTYTAMTDAQILEEYFEYWIDQRGSTLAQAEYSLVEAWRSARYCDAVKGGAGAFDHSACDGHPNRVFESKADARSAPDGLLLLVRDALKDLTVAMRDVKKTASPSNSSASSPPANGPAEETPSSSAGTPAEHPGPSPQRSVTP